MLRVLLVDDEPKVCEGMKCLIDWNQYGFGIPDTAGNGEIALGMHRLEKYDLIVTDLKMPVMGGLELIGELKKEKDETPVIIVSAYGEFSFAQEAMSYGVRYYLLKPVNEDVFCGFLSRIAEENYSLSGMVLSEELDDPEESENSSGTFQPRQETENELPERQFRMSENGAVNEIQKYIDGHYTEELTLNVLARLFGFSPVYLGRLFKNETGINFNDYLNQTRINTAKRMIRDGKMLIYEIADTVGYNNLNYFYKRFRENTGLSPKEYADSLKGAK